MKLAEMPSTAERTIRLTPIGSAQIDDGRLVRLTITPVGVTITVRGYAATCLPPDDDDAEWLVNVLATDAYVAELVKSAPQVLLRVLAYDRADRWVNPRSIGVDDLALDQAAEFSRRRRSVDEVCTWLTNDVVSPGDEGLAIVATGGSTNLHDHAFRLVGGTLLVDVRVVDDRLLVHRITSRRFLGQEQLWLIRGVVRFTDATRNAALTPQEREELRRFAQADNAYLAIWREYNKLERDAASLAAREIGWSQYDQRKELSDGLWEFELTQSRRADQLRDTIGQGSVGLEASAAIAVDGRSEPPSEMNGSLIGQATVSSRGTILIHADSDTRGSIPHSGYVSGAYTLDRVRIERREHAQASIAAGRSAPARQLARLLADEQLLPVGRQKHYDPLSHRVRQILGGEPTEAQVTAIDLAVNSSDIVLIQGPPGTGKTRVIAAIQARLSEINHASTVLGRRVLLTSYQHDAVANLVQVVDDGRLPAVKLGRRNNSADEAYLGAWANEVAERLRARHADAPVNRQLRALQSLNDRAIAYALQPSDVFGTIGLLTWLSQLSNVVGPSLAVESRRLARELEQKVGGATSTRGQREVVRVARALRVTPGSFADDGLLTLCRANENPDFFAMLDDAQHRLLERVVVDGRATLANLHALRMLRAVVIDQVLDTQARSAVVATMPQVEALLTQAQTEAEHQVQQSVSPIDRAVEDFRRAIVEQPAALRNSLQAHTRALAATCQQAVSGPVRRAQQTPFDTVIIDEAARANPLDLMIPMALATGRIVLVGDHRQLPQLLDETLASQLSSRHDPEVVQAVLSRSLFERLFTKLRELQGRDPTTKRAITLNQQFRTHPVLGGFISAQFYAPHGEQLSNAITDPSQFRHGVRRYGEAACAWIDVPAERGLEVTGHSTSRPVEAGVIVSELHKALVEDRSSTFGIITFYKGQEDALWRAMAAIGLAVPAGRNFELNLNVPHLLTDRELPRVRIGTVDAFQGREFDVVYLSTTRSNMTHGQLKPKFGFLVLPNRLCVAMSRQRKLLVVVGDAAMFTSDAAREAVPQLAAYHDLTGGAYGHRRSV